MPLHSRIKNVALEQQIKLQEWWIATVNIQEWSASRFGYLIFYYPGYRQMQIAGTVASSTAISGRACLRRLVGTLAIAPHAHVRYQVRTRAIYSRESSIGTGFSPSTSILPRQYQCTSVHTHISLSFYDAVQSSADTKYFSPPVIIFSRNCVCAPRQHQMFWTLVL